MRLVSITSLPEEIQADIDDTINCESWELVFYNPKTQGVRYYDNENCDSTKMMSLQEDGFVQVNLGY
jgi:hypothetical protein